MSQRLRESCSELGGREGGRRKGSRELLPGAILQREGTQSSTVISFHLQPAQSRILIADIPLPWCLHTHDGPECL